MKRTIQRLAITAMLFASGNALAECKIDPDWTAEKVATTLAACKAANQPATREEVVAEVSEYAQVAKSIAEAVGIAAREVGVATNEFIKTDAGKITIFFVAWHVFGEDIKGVVFGIPLAIFAVWLFFALLHRIRKTGEFVTVKGMFGQEKSVPVLTPIGRLSENSGGTLFIVGVVCLVILIVALMHIL